MRGDAEAQMNLALWKKAVSDAWLTLVVSCVLLILFCWLFVWLMSFFDVGAWSRLLNLLPDFVQPMVGVPMAKLASPAGQLSILFAHIVTILVCVGWAVGRGSDSIAGEIGRGTMDLILSLPVWRFSVMAVPAVVATVGRRCWRRRCGWAWRWGFSACVSRIRRRWASSCPARRTCSP